MCDQCSSIDDTKNIDNMSIVRYLARKGDPSMIVKCPNPKCLYHKTGWVSRLPKPMKPKRCPRCLNWLDKAAIRFRPKPETTPTPK